MAESTITTALAVNLLTTKKPLKRLGSLTAATALAQTEPQKSPPLATVTPPPNVQTAGKIPAEKSPPPPTSPVAQTQGEITTPAPEDKNPPPPFDTANMDTSVKPSDDFFLYANGGWIKRTPIPPEYSRWGSFNQLIEKNNDALHDVAERAGKETTATDPDAKKVGDYYASGMDEAKVEVAHARPLADELKRIDGVKDRNDVLKEIAHLHTLGVTSLFGFTSGQDDKNSTMVIAQAYQGGLGLPDRDYYTKADDDSKKLRDQYVQHVTKMLTLLGEEPKAAGEHAKKILALETSLAQASRTKVELRDPQKNYNKMKTSALQALTPDFKWDAYFKETKLPDPGDLNVGQPDFFKGANKVFASTPIDIWKEYFRWHLVHATAEELSADFVNENFNFYETTLRGTKQIKPRWKRVVASTDSSIGEALGKLYVADYFPPESKARMLDLVNNLRSALADWIKIGKPVDRSEWGMTPPTVNAYYNPKLNEIVFPAGILQPPFFNPKADDAVNYGGIGAVIGHEMTHGFDDEGRQFDEVGNLRDWWTPESAAKFKERSGAIVKQYSEYEPLPGLHVNGELTQGENIADIGGVKIAYAALQKALAGKPQEKIDGLTPEQRFFLSFATIWKSKQRDEDLKLMVNTNPHSPARYRVNGPVSDLVEFQKAFNLPDNCPMVRPPDKKVNIW